MPALDPIRIDAFADAHALADANQTLTGSLAAKKLPRLRAAVLDVDAIRADLRFKRDFGGHCIISGQVAATVTQTCQRCMEPVGFPLDTQFSLVVVGSEQEADQLPESLPDNPDAFIQEKRLTDIAVLIEDELLLAMPLIARHEDSGQCGPRASHLENKASQASSPDLENKPFQVLKDLKLR